MPDIINPVYVPLKTLMENIQRYKFNPSLIQRRINDHLYAVTNGQVDLVDPTNPLVFLMESSAVNTAVAIQENAINLKKQYPIMAVDYDDLYMHMSDKDFANRFSTPSKTRFKFMIQVQDLLSKMIESPADGGYKVTIPRNTTFSIDGYVFSIQYPIDIVRYYSNVVEVRYDATTLSPLQSLKTNIIDYTVRTDSNGVSWLYFEIDVTQFTIESTQFPVQASSTFSFNVDFTERYYYSRVWYRSSRTASKWIEIRTTHTDQVYDPYVPTAILKVKDHSLNLYIPSTYIDSGVIDGIVRIDVYTTRGALSLDLSHYVMTAFQTTLQAIDELADISVYTNAFLDIVYVAYSDLLVSGGTSGVDFETLRQSVIYNGIANFTLPITNIQLEYYVQRAGFNLVKNVDVITNRVFLATKDLPLPINPDLITPANITIGTFITNIEQLILYPFIYVNLNRYTIPSNVLCANTNGVLSFYDPTLISQLLSQTPTNLTETINTSPFEFLYSPYYYVLDNTRTEFGVRAYHLDRPTIDGLNFISQNPSLQLPVNTGQYTIDKIDAGYRLTIVTKSGNYYQQLEDRYVYCQIAFRPIGEQSLAYLNGTLKGRTSDNERIFQFDILTAYDIDHNDTLYLTNLQMFANEIIATPTALTQTFYVYHITSSVNTGYQPMAMDREIGKILINPDVVAITKEALELTFGYALSNLWTRSRSADGGQSYQTYQDDVVMTYDMDVYEIDPTTQSIFTVTNGVLDYHPLHRKGDIVYDSDGQIVYRHRRGDTILDVSGHPTLIPSTHTLRYIDMLLIDGKYYFATGREYTDYRHEIASTISSWVVDNLGQVTDILLEQTRIYFHPNKTLGMLDVLIADNNDIQIPAQQRFTVECYVNNNIFRDTAQRTNITQLIIRTIDQAIHAITVNISDITQRLKEVLGSSVVTIRVSGLGGRLNLETVTLLNDETRLSLQKRLLAQDDGSIIVIEDIDVQFYSYELNQ